MKTIRTAIFGTGLWDAYTSKAYVESRALRQPPWSADEKRRHMVG